MPSLEYQLCRSVAFGKKMMSERSTRWLTDINLKDAEKRYRPSKHYVFIIAIRWSDSSEYVIYRKYSDFYDFHLKLLEQFPEESGSTNPDLRTIPYLPGRRFLRRTEVRKVATKRQEELSEYCRTLLRLTKIREHQHVIDFFLARDSDIKPPRNACQKPRKSSLLAALLPFLDNGKKKQRSGLSRSASFGSSGKSEKSDISVSGPIVSETHRAIADYTATKRNEISLKQGQTVDVVEKNENGWWFVTCGETQGWAPASFLESDTSADDQDEPEPLETFERYMTTHDYDGGMEDEVSFSKGATVDVMHKLLDGWWIVQYDGEVGYAPATYLTPYKNPHLTDSPRTTATINRLTNKPSPKPIPQRRCTIKQSRSKWNKQKPNKDLSVYRKRSVKMNELRRKKEAEEARKQAESVVVEEDEGELSDDECYENQEVINALSKVNNNNDSRDVTSGMRRGGPQAAQIGIVVTAPGNDGIPDAGGSDDDDEYENVEDELLGQRRENSMHYTSLLEDNISQHTYTTHAHSDDDEEDYDDVAHVHDYINVDPSTGGERQSHPRKHHKDKRLSNAPPPPASRTSAGSPVCSGTGSIGSTGTGSRKTFEGPMSVGKVGVAVLPVDAKVKGTPPAVSPKPKVKQGLASKIAAFETANR